MGVSRELRIDSTGVCEVAGVNVAGVTPVGVTFLVTKLEPKSEPCTGTSPTTQPIRASYQTNKYESHYGGDLFVPVRPGMTGA